MPTRTRRLLALVVAPAIALAAVVAVTRRGRARGLELRPPGADPVGARGLELRPPSADPLSEAPAADVAHAMPRRSRAGLTLLAAPVLALAAVAAFAPRSGSTPALAALPPPPRPALVVPRPVGLAPVRDASRVAPVRRAVPALAAPGPRAAWVASLSTRTPEGTTNVVELLGTARPERSGFWQRIRLAVLPNGTTGWVPRSALGGLISLDTRLVVDRARLRGTLLRDGVPIFSAPIGIGGAGTPTPAGEFYVRDVLTRYRSPMYGPIAFGTSARSATITDWPAGGYIGIHGTDQPGLIPGRISHGCIRMRNADILRLAALMPVGTPVIVR